MTTDTSERGLESLIVKAMTGRTGLETSVAREGAEAIGGTGWLLGDPRDDDREYAANLAYLRAFLEATQPESVPSTADSPGFP